MSTLRGIFLSYRRQDASGYAGRLREALARHFGRDSVFMDVDSIEPGAEFGKTIVRTLSQCRVVLAVIGPRWLDAASIDGSRRLEDRNDFVRLELQTALEQGVRVIPILVEGAALPKEVELPPVLAPLCRRQSFELVDSLWAESLARLEAAIEGIVADSGGVDEPEAQEAPVLEVRVLGPLEVLSNDRPVALAGTKERSVLAMLALSANHLVPTDDLLREIWGDAGGDSARRSLQTYVSNLRKALAGGARIGSSRDGYELEITPENVDVNRFAALVAEGTAARAKGDDDRAARILRAALGVWRGPCLADLTHEPFAATYIRRLQDQRLDAVESCMDAELSLGRHAELLGDLEAIVNDNPLRDRLRAQLMLALYRCERETDALEVFRRRPVSPSDAPGPELQAVNRAILTRDPSLRLERARATARLAGFIDGSGAAERSAGNLPAAVSSFVGRHRELEEVARLLETSRLVTLTGPGGGGKTRLALEAAGARVPDLWSEAWFVELAPLAEGSQVASKLAAVLGIAEDSSRPTRDAIVDGLGERRALIVLDNCEHVIDAAATLLDAILAACPGVRVLATSREALRIAAEQVYRVPPLGVPDADDADFADVAACEAVQLFAQRAAQQDPKFSIDAPNVATIARLCRRLEGIPLAIELTAARVGSMSVAAIEHHLDERFRLLTRGPRTGFDHQRTLRASLDWSWDLLDEVQRAVFARLGVFAGGCDLEAAEEVAGGHGVQSWEVLDHLASLVDKSLVQVDETAATTRYRLLDTLREYARLRLAELDDGATLEAEARHRDYFLALAEKANAYLVSHGQAEWLERLDAEHDNLRAALAYCIADSDPVPGLRLCVALWRFWLFRGHAAEGIDTLTALLDRADARVPSRGRALVTLAGLIADRDNAAADVYSAEALTIGQAHRDESLIADALSMQSWARFREGRLTEALELADLGLSTARALGDPYLTGRLLNNRGSALNELGDTVAASACYSEAGDLFRRSGNRIQASWVLSNLGYSKLVEGDTAGARTTLVEALAASRSVQQNRSQAFVMFNLGLVEFVDADLDAARALFAQTVRVARTVGDAASVADGLFGLALSMDRSQAARAALLLGAAEEARARLGIMLEHLEAGLRDADYARLRETLGEDFESQFEAGRALPLEEALELALAWADVALAVPTA